MFDEAFMADPYPTYERLRAAGPLHWFEGFRDGAWLVPRHADVMAGFHDPLLSSQRGGTWTAALPPEAQHEFVEFNRIFNLWMLLQDDPQHARLRTLVNRRFTPHVVRELRPRIEHTVDRLLDGVAGSGTFDFMADFARILPVRVIAELLGVPEHDHRKFEAWTRDFEIFFGSARATIEQVRAARDGIFAMHDYFRALLPQRRGNPGGDLVSLLVRNDAGHDALTEDEVLAQCSMLFMTGHETVQNLLCNGLLALLQHPEQCARMRSEPSLLPSAVRECVRYNSPVQIATRRVAEDHDWHGKPLCKGQTILLLLGSANRDAAHFENPDALDVARNQGAPLSFGHGAHFCLGQALGSLEVEIAFGALFRRFPDLRLESAEHDWTPSPVLRGLKALPISLTAG